MNFEQTQEALEEYRMLQLKVTKLARDLFAEKGGAVGQLVNNKGQICIMQAFHEATMVLKKNFPYSIESRLNDMCSKRYGMGLIEVNDHHGKEAILSVLDRCVKELEEENA